MVVIDRESPLALVLCRLAYGATAALRGKDLVVALWRESMRQKILAVILRLDLVPVAGLPPLHRSVDVALAVRILGAMLLLVSSAASFAMPLQATRPLTVLAELRFVFGLAALGADPH